MERFVVPLASLEAAAGLSFFRQGALGEDIQLAPHLSAFDSLSLKPLTTTTNQCLTVYTTRNTAVTRRL